MPDPEVISTLLSSRNITQRLCNYRSAEIGLSLEGFRLGTETGEITLISIIDKTNQVFVFDVYKNPGLVQEGGLGDLLRCARVTKAVHNCQRICPMFYWRYGIIVRNVFDVQVAHGLVSLKILETSARIGSSGHQFKFDVLSSDRFQSGDSFFDQCQAGDLSSNSCNSGANSSDQFQGALTSSHQCQTGGISFDNCQAGGILVHTSLNPVALNDQPPSSGLCTDRSTSSRVSTFRSTTNTKPREQSPVSTLAKDHSSCEVPLGSLKDICEMEGVKFSPNWIIKHNGESSKFYWRTRPVTSAMLKYLVETVSVLPTLASSLKRHLSEDSLCTVQRISQRKIRSKMGTPVHDSSP